MIVFVLAITAVCVYYLLFHRKCNRYLDKIPGPPNIPFIGSSIAFCSTCGTKIKPSLTTSKFHIFIITEILPKLYDYYKEYGSILKFRIGPLHQYVLFADAKSAKQILSSPKYIDKSDDYEKFHSWLSTGLLTSTGEKWAKRRKLITPTFHFSILEGFVDIFDKNGSKLVEILRKVYRENFDVYPFIGLCSLDIVCGEIP